MAFRRSAVRSRHAPPSRARMFVGMLRDSGDGQGLRLPPESREDPVKLSPGRSRGTGPVPCGGRVRTRRLCLCGMLASDFATLPKPMKDGVRAFFDANEAWLTRVIE